MSAEKEKLWREGKLVQMAYLIPSFSNHERFLKFIRVDDITGCWNWSGSIRNVKGYGSFGVGSRVYQAHRVSYSIFKGSPPESETIDHICKNRLCVNPDHLRSVDWKTNTLENSISFSAINAKKTHCPYGHEYAGGNLMIEKKKYGGVNRKCKICFRETQRRYRNKKKVMSNENK